MITALVSLLTDRPIRPFVAMTGEITLSGVVLPIGGVKEKVLAARRSGIRQVILPAENEAHLIDEVPSHLRGDLEITLASTVEQAVELALTPVGGTVMYEQRVKDVMTRQVFTVTQDASIRDIARLMRDEKIGDVLVTDAAGKLVGIVTDRDVVVRAVAEGNDLDQLRARDICSDHVVSLPPTAIIEEAVKLMADNAIRRLPVVENDVLVGIVTIGDLAAQRDPNSTLGEISRAVPNN